MKNKSLLLIFTLAAVVLGASACVKAASKAPKAAKVTPTTGPVATFPLPGTADDIMGQLESFATQTAIAIQGPGSTQAIIVNPAEVTPLAGTPSQAAAATTPVPPTEPSGGVTVPTATPGIPKTYTLHVGEFPFCLARRFNVNPNELMRINGIGSGDTLHAGTVLKIPQSGDTFPGKRTLRNHPTTYTVVAGDSIYSIACLFGDVDPEAIAYANNLKSPYKISSGDKLKIP
jgi:LysM repeat protein